MAHVAHSFPHHLHTHTAIPLPAVSHCFPISSLFSISLMHFHTFLLISAFVLISSSSIDAIPAPPISFVQPLDNSAWQLNSPPPDTTPAPQKPSQSTTTLASWGATSATNPDIIRRNNINAGFSSQNTQSNNPDFTPGEFSNLTPDAAQSQQQTGFMAKLKSALTRHRSSQGAALGQKCNPQDPQPCAGENTACVDSKILFVFHRNICATDGDRGAEGSPCEGPSQPELCQDGLACLKKHFWKAQKFCIKSSA